MPRNEQVEAGMEDMVPGSLTPNAFSDSAARRPDFFISRAGADAGFASVIGRILEDAGHRVILQQWDFANSNFMGQMHAALKTGARVIALLSPQYFESEHCLAEALNAIGQDPLNKKSRLIVMRIAECAPDGIFTALTYWDLVPIRDNAVALRDMTLAAIRSEQPRDAPIIKPLLGTSPFSPTASSQELSEDNSKQLETLAWNTSDATLAFDIRFGQAFPGVRGTAWFYDITTITNRLKILLQAPLQHKGKHLAWWWRGSSCLHIQNFKHIGGSHFLMNIDELNIRRIAAINPNIYYRSWVYVEAESDEPTGLYDHASDGLADYIERIGHTLEEYGLVDGKLPVSRHEYDDGATIIDGQPVNITGRAELRCRYTSPYNFIIAPNQSPINNINFEDNLESYLNKLLKGEDVFDEMANQIRHLPRKHSNNDW
jgi:hypothetical protein